MYRVVKAKFSQRPVFKQILFDTGTRRMYSSSSSYLLPMLVLIHIFFSFLFSAIAEHCEDKEWGDGKDGTGKNYLGKILMRVRDELRNALQDEQKSTTEQTTNSGQKATKKKAADQPVETVKKPKRLKSAK